MKNLARLLFLVLIAFNSFSAFAATQHLVSITNDEDKEVLKLYVKLDDRADIVGLITKTYKANGSDYGPVKYDIDKASTGIVMYRASGKDVVKLFSNKFANHQGGEIFLDYLYNGVSGKRAKAYFDISRDGDVWKLTKSGKKVKKMHFVSNKKYIVGTIGIKEITVK